MSNKDCFYNQINYFSRYFKVTAIDFPGFGGAEKLKSAFSVLDYALWCVEVFRILNISKPNVIAHSFGCRVVVKMASIDSGLFDKILLTGPAGIILPRKISYKIKVGVYKILKHICPKFASSNFGSYEYRSLSPIMKESYKKIVNEDLREDAKKISNSVIIIQGKEDNVTTIKEAEIYNSSFKNSKLKIIDGDHFAFLQNPVSFNLFAEEFFIYE